MSKNQFSASLRMIMKINTLPFPTTLSLHGAGRLWSEVAQHDQLLYSVVVWSLYPWFIVIEFRSYKISCSTNDVFLPSVSNKLR